MPQKHDDNVIIHTTDGINASTEIAEETINGKQYTIITAKYFNGSGEITTFIRTSGINDKYKYFCSDKKIENIHPSINIICSDISNIYHCDPKIKESFEEFVYFCSRYNKKYFTEYDKDEFLHRFAIFIQHLEKIDSRNNESNNDSSRNDIHGINKYSDLSPNEFQTMMGHISPQANVTASSRNTTNNNKNLSSNRFLTNNTSNVSNQYSDCDSWVSSYSCSKTITITQDNTIINTILKDVCSKSCQELPPLILTTKIWNHKFAVRNQGKCGNCWTYSTTEALRSYYKIHTNNDIGELSTQYLISCLKNKNIYGSNTSNGCSTGKYGCCGGIAYNALQEIIINGIPLQSSYGNIIMDCNKPFFDEALNPWTKKKIDSPGCGTWLEGITYSGIFPSQEQTYSDSKCDTIPKQMILNPNTQLISFNSEREMAEHVINIGPIIVGIDSSQLHTYTGGIISTSTKNIDHSVLIIGIDAIKNAWIIQNSWGPDWGTDISGNPVEIYIDKYSNCKSISENPKSFNLTLQQAQKDCPLYFSNNTKSSIKGGFFYIAYGNDVAGISQEAFAFLPENIQTINNI